MTDDPSADRPLPGLEIRGTGGLLLDEPFLLRPRGAEPDETLVWRGRLRDDDGRVWRANAARAEDLGTMWAPSKGPAGPIPALTSLRPVAVDVRLELPDRRTATREITRVLLADGVRVRRWREGVVGTLLRPADEAPTATVVVDARSADRPDVETVAALAGALLASRGVLVLTVVAAKGTPAGEEALVVAAAQLARVPGAGEVRTLGVRTPGEVDGAGDDGPAGGSQAPERQLMYPVGTSADTRAAGAPAVVLPAGIPGGDPDPAAHATRAAAWDALLAELGARPRATRD